MSSPLYKKMTCWKGYVAKGKKKSPSGKKTKSGRVKMVNNCVKKSPAKQSKPKFTDKLFEKSERLQSKADKAASQGKNKKAARLENRVARVEKREGKRRAKYNY